MANLFLFGGAAPSGGISGSPNLELWLTDPENNFDGNNWTDSSGNGNTASETTNTPDKNATGWGGSDYSVDFNGSTDFLNCNGVASLYSGNDKSITVMWAAQFIATTAARAMWSFGNDSTNTPWVRYALTATEFELAKTDDTGSGKTPSGGTADTNRHIFTLTINGTTATLLVDGVAAFTDGDIDVGTTTLTRFSLGCLGRTTNAALCNCRYKEVAMWSAVLGAGDEATYRADMLSRCPVS